MPKVCEMPLICNACRSIVRLELGVQMIGISVAVMLLATLGGAWGWRVGTKRLYRHSVFDGRDERTERRWRLVERYLLTLLYAASVAAGVAVLIAVMTKR